MREADGASTTGALRVRFGEVEARGVALTRRGRARYDELLAATLAAAGERAAADPAEIARGLWEEGFPRTERELAARDMAFFTYHLVPGRPRDGGRPPADLPGLLDGGWVEARPIVYEDFLPASAAGIFRSNLGGAGSRDDARPAAAYDSELLSAAAGRTVLDPFALYEEQQAASLEHVTRELGLPGPPR